MSAIVGILRRDGAPVSSEMLARMTAALAHRGPHGLATWCEGPLGLGYCALWATPEARHERLPLANRQKSSVIVADVRLDNRDELHSAALAGHRTPEVVGDAGLIQAAYERWGRAGIGRLLGDFAFALWDRKAHTLFCARDQFGVKPLYYYLSERIFAFATEMKALLLLDEVPYRLDDAQARAYLAGADLDPTTTLFAGIRRLLPAHWLAVSAEGASLGRYWQLDPSRELRRRSDAEYAEGFRAIFSEAVRCRLRSLAPVGALLSGGLDSSAIVCTARELLRRSGAGSLPVFSAHFPSVAACDETAYIDAVLAGGGLEAHSIVGDQVAPWARPERWVWHLEEAHQEPGVALGMALFGCAQSRGVQVLLDGSGGDEVVSHGYGHLHQIGRAGRWLALARELAWMSRVGGENYFELLGSYGRAYAVSPVLHRLRRALRGQASPADTPALVAPDERVWHYHSVTAAMQPMGLELLDRAAGAFGIEPRYPFWDRRLVEYCLALPSAQKLRRGWGRYVLRQAMGGILPETVRWRTTKTDFTPGLLHGMNSFEQQRIHEVLQDEAGVAAQLLDLPALREALWRIERRGEAAAATDVFVLWRAVTFAVWLRQSGITADDRPARPGALSLHQPLSVGQCAIG